MSLRGVRIWLSAAVPKGANDALKRSMLAFIESFANYVFRLDGHILHGSHPTVTPTLLKVAREHAELGGRKDCLTLAVSRLFSKQQDLVPVREWRETCVVYETPEALGPNARDDSLRILRQWMSERSDAFVAVGGLWWKDLPARAGVPIEAELAFDKGIPCFLLGGLGGAAREFLDKHPEVFQNLKNGLNDEANRALALNEDVHSCVDTVCDQLIRLPLVRGRVVDGISFRILALDGGGIKGAYTASVLAKLESALGQRITDHFDLIAGTSTGGILAIGLGMGMSAQEMLQFYRERGAVIFPVTSFHENWWRKIRHSFMPKYSQDVLLKELQKAFFKAKLNGQTITRLGFLRRRFRAVEYETRTLGDSSSRLVIPAYDAVSGACHTFRTPHHELLQGDAKTNAAEVALATAAAPTYFASAKVRNMLSESAYVDGGVWANTPAMAAILEAVCYLGVPLDRIDVLSIGTTQEPFDIRKFGRTGWVGWAKKLIELLMNAQVQSSLTHVGQLVGEPRFLRINTTIGAGIYSLDGAKQIEDLIALGNKAVDDLSMLMQVKSRFLNGVHSVPWKTE